MSRELLCNEVAMPWILDYPWYFLYDWLKEVVKATFDLYASQLVAIVNKSHMYDPLEEFLSEKIALCLYKQPMHWFMRFIIWLECIFTLFMWIGLFAGLWTYLIYPLITKNYDSNARKQLALWVKTFLIIGGMLVMTGGFGYARLRMPVDPLLITLSVTWWYYMVIHYYFNKPLKRTHEKTLCAMA